MTSKERYAIGIDIGGTKIILALVSERGDIIHQKVFSTNSIRGPQVVLDEIIKEMAHFPSPTPVGIGIGVAGQVSWNGTLTWAPNLEWKDVPLRKIFRQVVNMPVAVLNDVRAAAWGEWNYGTNRRCHDMICLMIGTGIGGGVFVGGRMMVGAGNGAGELGHFPVQLNGLKCSCGNVGCLETVASGWGITKKAREASLDVASAEDVLKRAKQGDVTATTIVREAKEALVAACIGYSNVFNPSLLVVGGGLGLALPHLVEEIKVGIKTRAFKAASEELHVVEASLKHHAVAVGAAAFMLSQDETSHEVLSG